MFVEQFLVDLTTSLNVTSDRIVIESLSCGSIIVRFKILGRRMFGEEPAFVVASRFRNYSQLPALNNVIQVLHCYCN